ncbi:hypothetical protein J6590_088541 [Homalodisca vitripennis]|nr:hypothetical protein J6590_088541 [Homalodisca vitripennis]
MGDEKSDGYLELVQKFQEPVREPLRTKKTEERQSSVSDEGLLTVRRLMWCNSSETFISLSLICVPLRQHVT